MSSYNYSYNVLINRLEAFAAGHFLIKRFTHGQIDLSDQLQDDEYPFMHVTPDTIEPVQGGMQFGFHIMFADIPRDKEYKAEYQREVISDCVRLGQDLIAELRNGLQLFGFDVQLINSPVFEPFMEEQKNTVTGVAFTVKLEVPWDWSACDIPAIWAVGGSSSGGSGSPIGIVLRTNGVDNAVQNVLDLVNGSNVTIVDNGDGSVTINASGGGGGGGIYVSTEFSANHTSFLNNEYEIGDRVWYNGNVYACIANNDGILPTNTTYWTLESVGYRLRQNPADWDASSGDTQILNKPLLATVATSGDYNDLINTPSPQGLQGVINNDNDLTVNNIIEGNGTNLVWNGNGAFEILPDPVGFFQVKIGKFPPSESILRVEDTFASMSTQGNTTQVVKVDPTGLYIQTPAVSAGTATVGQVLTLGNASTGAVEYTTITPGTGTVTSVGLSMPSAFNVTNSPVTTSGTLTVTGAGNTGQYVRGDGTLANFPSTGGGGGQILYFNGNISQGTIGGNAYYQLGTAANTGPAANFTRATTGVIARFITDVNSPNHLIIPSGVWTIDVYLSETGGGANNAEILAKLFTYNGSTFTLVGTSPVEQITNGNVPDLYTFSISVPNTVTAANNRIHIEFDIQNTNGKTVTLYTEDGKIGEVHTTYAIGLSSLNGLTANTQNFATGTAGTDFAIISAGSTHTFNLPTASAANRGALSSADWSTFNGKQNNIGLTTVGTNLATLPNPSAIRYLRINADNTISALTLSELKTDLSLGSDITVVVASNVVNVGTTFEDVTGLSFAVTANKTYKWRATVSFGLVSGTMMLSSNGPTTSINNARFTIATGATTNGIVNQTAYDTGTNVAGTSNGLVTADGIVRVTASGTWTIRFRCSIAGNLTIRAGSVLEYAEVL